MANRLQIQNIIAVTIFLSNETWRLEENKVKVRQRLIIKMFVIWQVAKSRMNCDLYSLEIVILEEKNYKASTLCVSIDHFIYTDLTKFYSCGFVNRDKVQLWKRRKTQNSPAKVFTKSAGLSAKRRPLRFFTPRPNTARKISSCRSDKGYDCLRPKIY